MNEQEMTPAPEAEDLTDELSDEALDRQEGAALGTITGCKFSRQ
jgi:hypothetical protein